jgi:para-aminobenzoate synthetase
LDIKDWHQLWEERFSRCLYKVVHAKPPMHGRTSPIIHNGKELFKGIPSPFAAVRYHSLIVSTDDLPSSLLMTAWSSGSLDKPPIVMGLTHKSRPIWTVQFHPESICTDFGQTIINNFISLVDERWSGESSRPSDLPMPEFLSDISAIPPPLICPNSPVTTNFKILVNKLDFMVDSESVFKHFYSGENHHNNFWLDSAKVEKGLSRYSFMGDISGPEGYRISYSLEHRRITKTVAGKSSEIFLDSRDLFFEHLSRIIHQSYVDRSSLDADLQLPPFIGGLVGYIGYEMKSETLKCSSGQKKFVTNSVGNVPDSSFLFTDRVIIFDHEELKMFVIALTDTGRLIPTEKTQKSWINNTVLQLEKLASLPVLASTTALDIPVKRISEVKLSHSREKYVGMIEESLSKISEGETYEVCLTTQLKAKISLPHPPPLEMYMHLRNRNPAPYAAYLSFDENLVLTSSSPERFLRIEENGLITMKPIKGTVKRASPANFKGTQEMIDLENKRRMTELSTGEKNRSENLMIVDLIRNDLNQISMPNSVHVPSLMVVESYATVHQLVSTVASTIRPELTAVDAVMRSFPPGIPRIYK